MLMCVCEPVPVGCCARQRPRCLIRAIGVGAWTPSPPISGTSSCGSFWFFIWIAALMVWFRCLFDLFGDRSLSGWAKAGWSLLLIFVPWLGALIYLIARGRSMTERQMAALADRQAEQEKYIQQVAGGSPGPGRPDRQCQVAPRLRSHQPGRVRGTEGEGARLTSTRPVG